MKDLSIGHSRNKLEKITKVLHSMQAISGGFSICRFWEGISKDAIAAELIKKVSQTFTERSDQKFKLIVNANGSGVRENWECETNEEHLAVSLALVEHLVSAREMNHIQVFFETLKHGVEDYIPGELGISRGYRHFLNYYFIPLIQNLIENIDDQLFIHKAILRYKQWCEWFNRNHLNEKLCACDSSRKEERILQPHLYEYLHQHGIEFILTTNTGVDHVGKPDLVVQNIIELIDSKKGMPFVGEVKYIDENQDASQARKCIISGCQQLKDYLNSTQLWTGYLIVYNFSFHEIEFLTTDYNYPGGIHQYNLSNGMNIYIAVLNLYIDPQKRSVSELAKVAKQKVAIDKSDV